LVIVLLAWRMLVVSVGCLLGQLITQLDKKFIGTDITIGSLRTSLGLCYLLGNGEVGLWVHIFNAQVLNPYPYSGDYMLKADDVRFDVTIPIFRRRRGLQLKQVRLNKVSGLLEYGGSACCYRSDSNLETVLRFMAGKKPSDQATKDEGEVGHSRNRVRCAICIVLALSAVLIAGILSTAWGSVELTIDEFYVIEASEARNGLALTIVMSTGTMLMVLLAFEVFLLVSLSVKVALNVNEGMPISIGQLDVIDGSVQVYGSSVVVQVGDIHYEDFSQQVGSYYADDLAYILIASMIKTVLGGVAGGHVAQSVL